MADPDRRLILHIEDTLAIQVLVRRILQRRPDLDVVAAGDGASGIRLAAERRPNLILLDVNLPDMRGDEVLAALRADPDLASLPVVMVSGDSSTADLHHIDELGAVAVLTKPFDPGQLLAVVEQLCPVGHAASEPSPASSADAEPNERATSSRAAAGLGPLVQAFVAEATGMIEQLRQAIADDDAETFVAVAHGLAGSSGLFGAEEMHRIALELEDLGRAGDVAGGAQGVEALAREINALARQTAT